MDKRCRRRSGRYRFSITHLQTGCGSNTSSRSSFDTAKIVIQKLAYDRSYPYANEIIYTLLTAQSVGLINDQTFRMLIPQTPAEALSNFCTATVNFIKAHH